MRHILHGPWYYRPTAPLTIHRLTGCTLRHMQFDCIGVNLVLAGQEFQHFRGNVNGNQSRSGLAYGKHFAMATTRRPRFIFTSSTAADYVFMAFPNRADGWISSNMAVRNDP